MGHTVNPLSYRLYNTRYWNNNWYSNRTNYSYLINLDMQAQSVIRKFFLTYINAGSSGIILVNSKVIRNYKDVFLYLYVHDGFLDSIFVNLKTNEFYLKAKKWYLYKFSCGYKKVIKNLNTRRKKKKIVKVIKKRLVLKYLRKLYVTFIKNKLLRIYWNSMKSFIASFLLKINFYVQKQSIFILNIKKTNISSNIISEFFFIRLRQYYTIWEILRNINSLFRKLMKRRKKRLVKGYKITCSGRFSRKQRATYTWKIFRGLSLSSAKSKLDYSFRTICLKYSSVTVKVWIRLNNRIKKKARTSYII